MFHTKFNKDTSVWSSAGIPPIFNTNNSMGNILVELMRLHGSRIAQVCYLLVQKQLLVIRKQILC